ncbi:transcriptional regulator [Planktotalea sp.]|uniref:P-II family nitrogen regulator n=1 Tax=Planktotalea sp. TaxID=2029877 RepID=UPI003297B04D
MQMYPAKRVEIVIEKPLEGRLTKALDEAGVKGYTVVPVRGGSGRSGPWTREGQVGRTGMVMVVCLIKPERLDPLLEAAFAVVERHIGVASVSDTYVLRAELF